MTETSAPSPVTAVRAPGPRRGALDDAYYLAHADPGDYEAIVACGLTALWLCERIELSDDVERCPECFPATNETPEPVAGHVETVLARHGVAESDIGAACADLGSPFDRP